MILDSEDNPEDRSKMPIADHLTRVDRNNSLM
jgi:hypothetical protein